MSLFSGKCNNKTLFKYDLLEFKRAWAIAITKCQAKLAKLVIHVIFPSIPLMHRTFESVRHDDSPLLRNSALRLMRCLLQILQLRNKKYIIFENQIGS